MESGLCSLSSFYPNEKAPAAFASVGRYFGTKED
jgi:hypothetical protein